MGKAQQDAQNSHLRYKLAHRRWRIAPLNAFLSTGQARAQLLLGQKE